MSYSEVKRLPIRYRRWYLDRLVRHFKDKNKQKDKTATDSGKQQNMSNFEKFQKQVNSKFGS